MQEPVKQAKLARITMQHHNDHPEIFLLKTTSYFSVISYIRIIDIFIDHASTGSARHYVYELMCISDPAERQLSQFQIVHPNFPFNEGCSLRSALDQP